MQNSNQTISFFFKWGGLCHRVFWVCIRNVDLSRLYWILVDPICDISWLLSLRSVHVNTWHSVTHSISPHETFIQYVVFEWLVSFQAFLSEILSINYDSDTRLSDWGFLRLFYFQANADIVPEIKSQSLPSISFPIQHSRSAFDQGALYKPNYWQYHRINRNQETVIFLSYVRGLVSIPGKFV